MWENQQHFVKIFASFHGAFEIIDKKNFVCCDLPVAYKIRKA